MAFHHSCLSTILSYVFFDLLESSARVVSFLRRGQELIISTIYTFVSCASDSLSLLIFLSLLFAIYL